MSEYVGTFISTSSNGKRAMVVFRQDGESITRHLHLQGGRWRGVPLSVEDNLRFQTQRELWKQYNGAKNAKQKQVIATLWKSAHDAGMCFAPLRDLSAVSQVFYVFYDGSNKLTTKTPQSVKAVA